MNRTIKMPLKMNKIREIAEASAEESWREFASGKDQNLLLDEFLESENAYMFFRNRDIEIPERGGFAEFSIVVSKKGNVREVQDHFPNKEKAQSHLELMSEYFSKRDL